MIEVDFKSTETKAVSTLSGGALHNAKGGAVRVGDVFKLVNNTHFTALTLAPSGSLYGAFTIAKSSGPPVPGDVFEVTTVKIGTSILTFKFLGNNGVRTDSRSSLENVTFTFDSTAGTLTIAGSWDSNGYTQQYDGYKAVATLVIVNTPSNSTDFLDNVSASSTMTEVGSTGIYTVNIVIPLPSSNASPSTMANGQYALTGTLSVVDATTDGTSSVIADTYWPSETFNWGVTTTNDATSWDLSLIAMKGGFERVIKTGITSGSSNGQVTDAVLDWDDCRALGIANTLRASDQNSSTTPTVDDVTFKLVVNNSPSAIFDTDDISIKNPIELPTNYANQDVGTIAILLDRKDTTAIPDGNAYYLWVERKDADGQWESKPYWTSAGDNSGSNDIGEFSNNLDRYFTANFAGSADPTNNLDFSSLTNTAGTAMVLGSTVRIGAGAMTQSNTKVWAYSNEFLLNASGITLGTISDAFVGQNITVNWTVS